MTKVFTLVLIMFSMQVTAQIRPVTVSSPVLVFPGNGNVVTAGQAPVFTWRHPTPAPSDHLTYKLRIVEIKANESPEDALRSNKPHFEKDSLKETISFQYPLSAPRFVAGKKYAWIVQALNKERKGVGQDNGYSKAVQFSAVSNKK